MNHPGQSGGERRTARPGAPREVLLASRAPGAKDSKWYHNEHTQIVQYKKLQNLFHVHADEAEGKNSYLLHISSETELEKKLELQTKSELESEPKSKSKLESKVKAKLKPELARGPEAHSKPNEMKKN
ncbi:hypothetical protein EVAR_44342_1 [Eumeta japonica]|uniref:Uncharacterized protein n=1 Tax=Eumeta variegata TaxID=151549 RepID=A0A4C1X9R0_EUMVA|nr:hypothetical protein EVAR_44342_1 [Eumeta japonica]